MTPFGDLPPEFIQRDTAAVAVVPVPYDGTSTYRKGADKGPAALLDASAYLELYDIETGSEVYRTGIHTAEPPARSLNQRARPEDVTQDVRASVDDILSSGLLPVVIGGEHSVSLGAIRPFAIAFRTSACCR